jgi:lipopolysaccharide export system ATP-binding protein
MVDLFGMFRRRAPKRGQQGFARAPVDITSLGDSMGDMLGSPLRDAPPLARDEGRALLDPGAPQPRQAQPQPQGRPRGKSNGAAAPRAGYLAVHGIKKSFGSRQVVRGVSIYVRRGEAVGLLGPNGAGKTTVFYMITGLIKPESGAIELDGHDVTKLPARPARYRLSAPGSLDFSRSHRRAEYSRGARSGRAEPQEARGRAEFAAGRVQHPEAA